MEQMTYLSWLGKPGCPMCSYIVDSYFYPTKHQIKVEQRLHDDLKFWKHHRDCIYIWMNDTGILKNILNRIPITLETIPKPVKGAKLKKKKKQTSVK